MHAADDAVICGCIAAFYAAAAVSCASAVGAVVPECTAAVIVVVVGESDVFDGSGVGGGEGEEGIEAVCADCGGGEFEGFESE